MCLILGSSAYCPHSTDSIIWSMSPLKSRWACLISVSSSSEPLYVSSKSWMSSRDSFLKSNLQQASQSRSWLSTSEACPLFPVHRIMFSALRHSERSRPSQGLSWTRVPPAGPGPVSRTGSAAVSRMQIRPYRSCYASELPEPDWIRSTASGCADNPPEGSTLKNRWLQPSTTPCLDLLNKCHFCLAKTIC